MKLFSFFGSFARDVGASFELVKPKLKTKTFGDLLFFLQNCTFPSFCCLTYFCNPIIRKTNLQILRGFFLPLVPLLNEFRTTVNMGGKVEFFPRIFSPFFKFFNGRFLTFHFFALYPHSFQVMCSNIIKNPISYFGSCRLK